ncbi:MAG: PIN domain-containing protein [Nocardioidaceae bacterium]|nr:PIN domain-containing protein [Nocardioidaceae bacterium]MCL2612185.1 PIN domain-containing protein [Nocardioidaceae bacterium]
MTISVVLADANILVSRTLRDYFLYAADNGAIEIRWSQQVLAEMSRNLERKFGLNRAATTRLESLMNDYMEYALVTVDPEDLATVIDVPMDAKDRHVLAAALSAEADILLTENVKHFPRAWMAERHIELLSAADLLLRLAREFPSALHAAHLATVRSSPKSEAEIFETLEAIVGSTVVEAIRDLTGGA